MFDTVTAMSPPSPEPPFTDLSRTEQPGTAEEWEQVRRSVAMLPPGAWAMRREQALHTLSELLAYLRNSARR